MNKAIFSFFLALGLLLWVSCERFDSNFFNGTEVKGYLLDNYKGEVDFTLDSNYNISSNQIYLNILPSKTQTEKVESYIPFVYIGDLSRLKTDTVILYFHGNRDHMDFYWPRAKLLANAGGKHRYGVMMFEYRGFGTAKGQSNEQTLYADAEAAIRFLQGKGVTSTRLIFYGFSLGCAPAIEMAYRSRSLSPSKVILEAPFASAMNLIETSAGLNMPSSYFTDMRVDNYRKIGNVIQPLMWIHGTDDDYLDIETNGRMVYNRHRGRFKEGHEIAGAGHSNVQTTWGFQPYLKAVDAFIRRGR
jgi:pimeloyl-ACP methyl ester carboxylesterase